MNNGFHLNFIKLERKQVLYEDLECQTPNSGTCESEGVVVWLPRNAHLTPEQVTVGITVWVRTMYRVRTTDTGLNNWTDVPS